MPTQAEAESSATTPRGRRGALAAVAAVAALAGAGLAWWRYTPHGVAAGADDLGDETWAQRYDTPDGGTLALADYRGQPLLLNFWASWCPPCVAEMPLLDAFYRAQRARGWTVVGLAIDRPTAVRAFLARTPVQFPIGLAGLEGSERMKRLGNAAGALPYTVVFDRAGRIQHRKMGKVTEAELAAWAGG